MSRLTNQLTNKSANKFHTDFSDTNELEGWAAAMGIPNTQFKVLAKDELYEWPHDKPLPAYIVINLGTTASGGTHWVAFSPKHNLWFDSFGGFPLQRVEDSYEHNGLLRYSDGQYQLLKDTACGLWATTALAAMHQGYLKNKNADIGFRHYLKRFKQGHNNNAALLRMANRLKREAIAR